VVSSLPIAYLNTQYDADLGIMSDTGTATTSGQLPPGLSVVLEHPPCAPTKPCSLGFYLGLMGEPTQTGIYIFNVTFSDKGVQTTQPYHIRVLEWGQVVVSGDNSSTNIVASSSAVAPSR